MKPIIKETDIEQLIVQHLTTVHHYDQGVSQDYDKEYGVDVGRLEAFLRRTQGKMVDKSRIFETEGQRAKFLRRLRSEITARGVVDVLRKGLKHLSNTFYLYEGLPSQGTPDEQRRYESNSFTVIRQLHYSKKDASRSIDLVICINGLPVLTIELKNRSTGQNVHNAIAQYRGTRTPDELLFCPKRCAVHLAVDDEEFYMCTQLCGYESWFLPFNKGKDGGSGNPVNPDGLRTAYLWEDILSRESLSDILEHYAQVVITKDKDTGDLKEINIWPRWHQLEVVRNLLQDTAGHPIGQRYLIQHSAGSGKSNSITWLAYQLVGLKNEGGALFDSVIIVTDRRNLDSQIKENMSAFQQRNDLIEWSDTSGTLLKLLKAGKQIVITTIQKFPYILDSVGSQLSGRRFALIIDEAHSSQSGKMSTSANQVISGSKALAEEEVWDEEDEVNRLIRQHMEGRRMAGNANFYAFTATPKPKTLETFGTPFDRPDGEVGHRPYHIYSMRQAIEEGFILDVLKHYIVYDSYYQIRKVVVDDPKYDSEQAMRKLRHYVERQSETIAQKAQVIVDHYCNRIATKIGGEARCMLCTASIERAIDYYYEVRRLLKEREVKYRAVIAFSGEVTYKGERVNEAKINGFPSSQIEERFRKGNYRFLVVADKFQTGYDEPLLHTMYVDKPLAGVQMVQTLSRLNRTCPNKSDTCVIDFVNSYEDVEKAFRPFYQTTILSRETDPNRLNDLLYKITGYYLYTEAELDDFSKLYWLSHPDKDRTVPVPDTIKERYLLLEEEDQLELKGAILEFLRTYVFLASISSECNVEWAKHYALLEALRPLLPGGAGEDTLKGLTGSVALESYALQQRAEQTIRLEPTDYEVAPLSEAPTAVVAEANMQYLSRITEEFNARFGDTNWQDPKQARQHVEQITEEVKADLTITSAGLNGDPKELQGKCYESLEGHIFDLKSKEDAELADVYMSDETFQALLKAFILDQVRRTVRQTIQGRATL